MASYRLRYSPLFFDDLDKITDYIAYELKNELASKTLIDDVEAAIRQRQNNPLSTAPYRSIGVRKHPYRRILVRGFLILHVVIGETIIIRRMLYGRSDIGRIL